MPRAPGYAPVSTNAPQPESFDSLQELADWSNAARPSTRHGSPIIPYIPRAAAEQQRRLIVCHDYKGGYSEKEDVRDYTFAWWHLTELFIYFSHRRVAPPPPDWVRTAHRHGCKILGTLIFEWDAGKADFDLLLGSDDLRQTLSTETADQLVDLAVERGFEGWLVNVEVPLGIRGGVGPEEHARALVLWLSYLRDETRRRIPEGETIWYDGANVDGVHWQNRLSSLNSRFFEATDSIFLNYFWRGDHVRSTVQTLRELDGRTRDEVGFGLDVFGRGQYGGGGFFSWLAIDLLEQSSNQQLSLAADADPRQASPSSDFSLALFAPGWTVESEHLGHSLATRELWQKWWEDELYLWTGSKPGPNVEREEKRMELVRKEERGVHRARELASLLAPGRDNVMAPAPFDYHALPPLPGHFRPLTDYFPTPHPPPSSSSFYTNFSTGAGHRFYLEGQRVLDSAHGWTDVDFSFPFPSLAIPSAAEAPIASLTDDDAWMGGFSLKVELAKEGAAVVPISPTAVPLFHDRHVTASVVWKSTGVEEVKLIINGGSARAVDSARSVEVRDLEAERLAQGWQKTSAVVTLAEGVPSATITSLCLAVSASSPTYLLVGSLSLSTSSIVERPSPCVSNVRWEGNTARWDVGRRVPSTSNSKTPRERSTWPPFAFFTLWYRPPNDDAPPVFLGTTSAKEFALDRGRLAGGGLEVAGVRSDGAVDSSRASCNV